MLALLATPIFDIFLSTNVLNTFLKMFLAVTTPGLLQFVKYKEAEDYGSFK